MRFRSAEEKATYSALKGLFEYIVRTREEESAARLALAAWRTSDEAKSVKPTGSTSFFFLSFLCSFWRVHMSVGNTPSDLQATNLTEHARTCVQQTLLCAASFVLSREFVEEKKRPSRMMCLLFFCAAMLRRNPEKGIRSPTAYLIASN